MPATVIDIRDGIDKAMNDIEARNQASKNIRQYVGEQYTWTASVARHISLFRSAVAKFP